jgi:hypothetical protein
MTEDAAQNGNGGFVVDDLLNMIVPFEFPFEGKTLKGKWYKYKTTTPTYVRTVMRRVRELREQVHTLTQQIIDAKNDDPDLPKLLSERDELEDQLQRTPYDWMATGITEWNAVRVNKEVLPISKETLDSWPLLLLNRLNEFFSKERTGENPTSPAS